MSIFIYIQLCFLGLILLIFSYKYFLLTLIIAELLIINISLLIYLILEGYFRIGPIFLYFLVFKVCERVMGLIILILVIRYYGDDYYYLFSLNKF